MSGRDPALGGGGSESAEPRRWSAPFIALVRGYQVVLGPWLGGRCRFYPSCSEYAIDAYREHGPLRGTWLTARRLARCHPLGGSGVDLVPRAEPDAHHRDHRERRDSTED